MTNLIQRLEQATEGSRELDAEIWFLDAAKADGPVKEGAEDYGGIERTNWMKGSIGIWDDQLPHYTTSVDAALTLVPDGFWVEGTLSSPSYIEVHSPTTCRPVGIGLAATPALAICIAARKARQYP